MDFGNQANLAFRKDQIDALGEDKKLFKKLDMYSYIEDLRRQGNKETFDFFLNMQPDVDPDNIKLLYFYQVGSRTLYEKMKHEIVKEFRKAQIDPNNLVAKLESQSMKKSRKGVHNKNIKILGGD